MLCSPRAPKESAADETFAALFFSAQGRFDSLPLPFRVVPAPAYGLRCSLPSFASSRQRVAGDGKGHRNRVAAGGARALMAYALLEPPEAVGGNVRMPRC